jgi:hypothetical protein
MSTYTGPTTLSGNGTITSFSFTWGYLEDNDVKVYVNGVLKTLGTDYNLNTPGTVAFGTAPANGASVQISRITDAAYEVYTGPLNNSDLNKTAVHGPYMAEEAKALTTAAGAFVGGLYDSKGDVVATSVPASSDAISVLGGAAAGDGNHAVYKRVVSFNSAIGDASGQITSGDGAKWERFLAFETQNDTLKLSDFLPRWSTPYLAFQKALQELFNSTGNYARLDLQGIPISVTSTSKLLITPSTYGTSLRGLKLVDMNIKTTGTGWNALDYAASFSGNAGSDKYTWIIVDGMAVDLSGGNTKDLVGCHLTGYQHATLKHFRCSTVGSNGIGIATTKYKKAANAGVGYTVGDLDVDNHGLVLIEPDITDNTTSTSRTSKGIHIEMGDLIVDGGWITQTQTGIYSTGGGFNTRGIHFSMAMSTNTGETDASGFGYRRKAIHVLAPKAVSIKDPEIDYGYIYIEAAPTLEGGAADSSFARISIQGIKCAPQESGMPPDPAGGQYGFVTFAASVPNTSATGISVDPDWLGYLGGAPAPGSMDAVKFTTVGSGTWDPTATSKIFYRPVSGGGVNPGDIPGLFRVYLAGTNKGTLKMFPNRTPGPGLEIVSDLDSTGAALVVEGSQILNTTPYAEVEMVNRSNSSTSRRIARMRAYRDGGNNHTKLVWSTTNTDVETEQMSLDKAGLLTLQQALSVLGTATIGGVNASLLAGSATFNPPSVAAGAETTTTVTVTGAALGDFARASFSLDQAGMVLSAYVSSANTVTVVFRNNTAGAIDLASGTLRVRVNKA